MEGSTVSFFGVGGASEADDLGSRGGGQETSKDLQ